MASIQLGSEWSFEESLGAGGFGKVFRVTSGEQVRALKLVPKCPGADRELLFMDLSGAVNVVPVLEVGEYEQDWALLMPLAECSLRDLIVSQGAQSPDKAIGILMDVVEALVSISGRVVHRDIKPDNVLMLDGKWSLADFGIARYAEATTDAETRKHALTAAYAAPERWRFERATTASDIYSLGVIAYELLLNALPFTGPTSDEFRDQHLHKEPPRLEDVPTPLATVVEECLFKAPEARPSAANIRERLSKANGVSLSESRRLLAIANLNQVRSMADAERARSAELTEQQRRSKLMDAARKIFESISAALLDIVRTEAPSAIISGEPSAGWQAQLGLSTLSLSMISPVAKDPWNWQPPSFDVVAEASILVFSQDDRFDYQGRSHSLWFADPVEKDCFKWYETAFMHSVLTMQTLSCTPFALPPDESAAKALWPGMAEYEVAWPFEPLVCGDLEQFTDRWIRWFAESASGNLRIPSVMPERSPENSWRRN
jgi:eukaryotic-like serine/threonine-protein kinase